MYGVQNQSIVFLPTSNIMAKDPELCIDKNQVLRLIKEYPELRAAYENNVHMNQNEPKRESQFT